MGATSLPTVVVSVGPRCDNACLTCTPMETRRRLGGKLGGAVYLQKMQELMSVARHEGARRVVLTGGEPTLHNGILDAVLYAKSLGYKEIELHTNGRRLAQERFGRDIVRAGVTMFLVSLHGPRPEVHDAISGVPGSFLETLEGLRSLARLGRAATVEHCLSASNLDCVAETAGLLRREGVASVRYLLWEKFGADGAVAASFAPDGKVLAPLRRAVFLGLEGGGKVEIAGIPPCVLGDLAPYWSPTSERPCAWEVLPPNLGPECSRCVHAAVCPGPPAEYTRRFGWSEFAPVVAPASRPSRR